jgi:hypothetical protein
VYRKRDFNRAQAMKHVKVMLREDGKATRNEEADGLLFDIVLVILAYALDLL